ncbi:MAG: class II fructose-bisphosphatase [Flavobacteriaceae bacterium]|nr:class II fructose-bisphosphatase [Flavobacteriaceae bacterium]
MELELGRDLAMELVRVTEAAAISAAKFIGTGDKNGGDKAAVDGMRTALKQVGIEGVVVIGEGEKDDAPMLYNGEVLGTGKGAKVDIAVDPVEGTNLLALGRPNAVATIAIAEKGSMWNPGSSFYMNKLVVGKKSKDVIDITKSITENLQNIAKAEGKKVSDLVVYMLDKPRHKPMIEEIRKIGAKITLHTDGDVLGALLAALPNTGVDVLMGIGGTPEGVLAACAVKAVGGGMQGMRAPQKEDELENLKNEGADLNEVLTLDTLVKCDNAIFAATGITAGGYLDGVKTNADGSISTKSLVIRSKTGTLRFVEGIHYGKI